ncbi:MAG: hypothetical protein Ta2G_04140 [Termitinemataceae bacterium]|nr:MAG: hypothetical protein Ta2G_04140 [Termitinemataceae bacterium]
MKKLNNGCLLALTCVLLLAGALISCGNHAGATIEAPPAAGPAYDQHKAYPLTVVAKEAVFVGEGAAQVLQIRDFENPETAPKPTANVSSAKKGASIEITVPSLSGYVVSGGLSSIVAPSKEKVSLSKYNEFHMPLGPATVTIVYIEDDKIFMVPTYYSNALYTLDIPRGLVDSDLPEPITTAFLDGDVSNGSPYGASIAYSTCPGDTGGDGPESADIIPDPENFLAEASWSFADSNWNDATNITLVNDVDISYFRINVKVKPKVKVEHPTISGIPSEMRTQQVSGTGKTVEEMYNEAVEKVYHFRVVRNEPNIDARLFAINISGTDGIYLEDYPTQQPVSPYGESPLDYEAVTYIATVPPLGDDPVVDVVAETNDPNSRVQIDVPGTSAHYGTANETVEFVSDTREFTITVQAEDSGSTKVYTIKLTMSDEYPYTRQATGGITYFDEHVEGSQKYVYEIHSFYLAKATPISPGGQRDDFALDFTAPGSVKPETVDILLVGGGGAGGNYTSGLADSKTGSGGGGGVIYIKGYALGESDTYQVKVGNGGGSDQASVIETFTADGSVRNIKAGQKGGDSFFGASLNDPNRLLAPGGGGGADNNNANGKLWGGKGGSSGGSTETNARGGYWNTVSTPLLDFYYDGSSKQPNGTVTSDFKPDTGMAWGNMGVVRRDGDDRRNNSWAGGGAGSEPTAMVRSGYNQAGIDYGRGIKIDITGTEREYARSFLSGQGNPTAGSSQTGNGGAGGNGKHGAAGGSGIVVVKWLHSVETVTAP